MGIALRSVETKGRRRRRLTRRLEAGGFPSDHYDGLHELACSASAYACVGVLTERGHGEKIQAAEQ